ncbi:aminotransferase class IV [Allorhodopirellula solitaria]|uniref:Branched-chain amino acid aminotransferase n=1 Tax=Allorhodopirellula solitaria TaxID=2527987 RepID=A0A5C5YFU1_9BACT|nr:aminotransferase class IV [Allorhodopirellula solitaria]TWT73361.1 branched-chain amino acid aminotransferase [Allorhodopirellula solitaria]
MTNLMSSQQQFASHQAYFVCPSIQRDGWLPFDQVCLPVDDLGFRQGVTAVERMRTYHGVPFRLNDHLRRWAGTLQVVRIGDVPPPETLGQVIQEALARNATLVAAEKEVGITMWATPGIQPGAAATFAVHLNRIDHAAVEERQSTGQPVVLCDVVQPPTQTWPRHAKVRCRLHYYLADAHARSLVPDATGVLADCDGSWTESSVASIALVSGREIAFAPAAQVLPGITQLHVRTLAKDLAIDVTERRLTTDRIARADAMLLMGTDTGLWFANRVHDSRAFVIADFAGVQQCELVTELQQRFVPK